MKPVLLIIADELLREQVRALLVQDNFIPLIGANAEASLAHLLHDPSEPLRSVP